MSWITMTMKFPGTCLVCGRRIQAGEQGMWSRGVGVKHQECAQQPSITCIVCGQPAGCDRCELAESCDIQKVSPLCICSRCDSPDAIAAYREAAARKFPVLGGD